MLIAICLAGLTTVCGAIFSLGALLEYAAPRALSMRRLTRRRGAVRRRKAAPWDGAIARDVSWKVRRLGRRLLRAAGAPWRLLCARVAQRRLRRIAAAPSPSAWSEIDYSAKRDRMIKWLGDDYVFAKPINRKVLAKPIPQKDPSC